LTGLRSADRADATRFAEPTVSRTDHTWRGHLVMYQQFLDGTRRGRPQALPQTHRSGSPRRGSFEQVLHLALLVLAFPALDDRASPIAYLRVEAASPIHGERSG